MSLTPPRDLPAALAEAGLHLGGPVGRGAGGAQWAALADDGARWTATVARPRSAEHADALRGRAERLRDARHEHLPRIGPLLVTATGALVLLTEEVPGTDLATVCSAKGFWLAGEVVTLLLPLASALEALHAGGLSHGDVSAANVVVTREGRPVLVDLFTGAEPDERGSPGVAAPERGAGACPAGDVHALAAVGLDLLGARVPSRTPTGPGDGQDGPADPAARLGRYLASVVGADPADRPRAALLAAEVFARCPPTALDLPEPAALARASLRRLAEQTRSQQTRRVTPRQRSGRHRRSRRPQALAAAGAVLVAACTVVVMAGRPADQADEPEGRSDPVAAAVRLSVDRAEALLAGDRAGLRAVTVPGSRAALADARAARVVASDGSAPVEVDVVSVELVRPAGAGAGWTGPGYAAGTRGLGGAVGGTSPDAAGTGGAAARVVLTARIGPRAPGEEPPERSVVLVLWPTGDGWLVSDVLPTPAPGREA